MKISGEIKGINKLIKDLSSLGAKGDKMIAQTTKDNAYEIAAQAKINAPKDLGTLSRSIKPIEINNKTWAIRANATGLARYAAYVEFGTGGLVNVPNELKDIAIQFIGKGVKQINMRPQPYLYPAFVKGRKQYLEDLKNDLKDLTKNI